MAKCVRRIFARLAGKMENSLDHVLNLVLAGTAAAYRGLLDLAGGIFVDGKPCVGATDDGNPLA